MIEVRSVYKYFGNLSALENISFHVARGDVVGLLGPNGAGKSTLMRILSCYLPTSEGIVRIDGKEVGRDSLSIRKEIGYFQEKVSIYPEMKVYKFMDFIAQIRDVEKKERNKEIYRALEICGLEEVKNRIIGDLSKGYKQRVGLAQALLNNPKLLILDEPTAGVDPKYVAEIKNLIKGLAGHTTVVFSSHLLNEISQVCDKIIIINNGKMIAVDTFENLKKRLENKERIKVQIESSINSDVLNKLKVLTSISSVEKSTEFEDKPGQSTSSFFLKIKDESNVYKELLELSYKNKWILKKIEPEKLSLDEIFFQLTSE